MSSSSSYYISCAGLTLVLGYLSSAVFFYYFPQLIHRRKFLRKKARPHDFVVISHRGGAGEAAENTLDAFDHSASLGVDIIELDCHLTKDERVVVSHDISLLRTAGVNVTIPELNYDELPEITHDALENETHDSTSADKLPASRTEFSKKNVSKKFKFPLLEEVFQRYPNIPINLDVKIEDDKLIAKINELIVKHKREDTIVWGSFSDTVVKKLQRTNPRIDSFFSKNALIKLLILHVTGLLPFVDLKENHLEIILPLHILKDSKKLPWGLLIPLRLIDFFFIRKSFVRHLQNRGITVYYWVLNTEEEFDYAIRLGIDGIMTDYPSKLIEYVKANHPHLKRPIRLNQ